MSEPATNSGWLRPLKAVASPRVRLVCFPHAGAGPTFFRDWLSLLPPDVELLGVLAPGRESRFKEPPLSSIDELASGVLDALAALDNTPLALFGHSLGGLIAYDVARRMAKRGDPRLSHLAVSSTRCPSAPRPSVVLHELADTDLRAELARLGGGPVLENDELFQLFLPALRADLTAFGTYVDPGSTPLSIPLLVLGGQTDDRASLTDQARWLPRAHDATIRLFTGGHFYLAPHRVEVVRLLLSFISGQVPPPDVKLHLLPLDRPVDELQRLRAVLDEAEQRRALRYLQPSLGNRFIASRGMTRIVLGRELAVGPKQVQFEFGPFGKPFLVPPPSPSLWFNVSHSGDVAVLGTSRHGELGVDLEEIRSQIDITGLSDRFFAADEREYMHSLADSERRAAFFAIWAGKEAYCKARGMGLQLPTDAYAVVPRLRAPWTVSDVTLPDNDSRPVVMPLNLDTTHSAAWAMVGPPASIQVDRFTF